MAKNNNGNNGNIIGRSDIHLGLPEEKIDQIAISESNTRVSNRTIKMVEEACRIKYWDFFTEEKLKSEQIVSDESIEIEKLNDHIKQTEILLAREEKYTKEVRENKKEFTLPVYAVLGFCIFIIAYSFMIEFNFMEAYLFNKYELLSKAQSQIGAGFFALLLGGLLHLSWWSFRRTPELQRKFSLGVKAFAGICFVVSLWMITEDQDKLILNLSLIAPIDNQSEQIGDIAGKMLFVIILSCTFTVAAFAEIFHSIIGEHGAKVIYRINPKYIQLAKKVSTLKARRAKHLDRRNQAKAKSEYINRGESGFINAGKIRLLFLHKSYKRGALQNV